MHKIIALFGIQIFLLAGCDATDPLVGAATDGTAIAKTLDDSAADRIISLYLEPESANLTTPIFNNRIIVAEPVFTVPVSVARAQGLVDGVNVVYVGSSCPELQAKYPDLYDCVEEEAAEFRYGEVESTANTDGEGFAVMSLGSAEKYRLRVQSFATEEDPKCFWGGEVIADTTSNEVSIPLLVFCE